MRVTAQTKAATRERIIDAARQLFAAKGFEASTTRDIADAAGIASGTLFNYFATKEDIVASLAAESVAETNLEFAGREMGMGSFEEELFAFVSAGLRKLKPLRKHLTVLFEKALSPLAAVAVDGNQTLRVAHLEVVARLAKHHVGELDAVALQLYWTLYIGVLMFWANDQSPKQENTLALLDESLAMFAGWLQRENNTEMKGAEDSCP
jgi:AcrR family transcriptional regulator